MIICRRLKGGIILDNNALKFHKYQYLLHPRIVLMAYISFLLRSKCELLYPMNSGFDEWCSLHLSLDGIESCTKETILVYLVKRRSHVVKSGIRKVVVQLMIVDVDVKAYLYLYVDVNVCLYLYMNVYV